MLVSEVPPDEAAAGASPLPSARFAALMKQQCAEQADTEVQAAGAFGHKLLAPDEAPRSLWVALPALPSFLEQLCGQFAVN
jgi:hypothetical protein